MERQVEINTMFRNTVKNHLFCNLKNSVFYFLKIKIVKNYLFAYEAVLKQVHWDEATPKA